MLPSDTNTGAGPGWAWLLALPRPVVALDVDGRVVSCNPAALDILRIPADRVEGAAFAAVAVPESDRGGFEEVLGLVRAGTDWSGELRLGAGPRPPLLDTRLAAVGQDGVVAGVVMTIDPRSSAEGRAGQLSERLTRLARVAAELQSTDDLPNLTNVVISHMADAAGATTASFSMLVDDETLALVGLRGGSPEAASRWATYPVSVDNPATVALRRGEPLFLSGRDEILELVDESEMAARGERSMLCLPLVVSERSVGVVTMSFPSKVEMDDAELEFYQVMADSCAQVLERIRAVEKVREQHEKLRFLAEASAELASSLDYESTLRNVAWLAVPNLADWCAISLEQDGFLRTLAVAHRDAEKIALVERLQEEYPAQPEDGGSYDVLRTGESQLIPEIPDELLVQAAKDDRHLEMLRSLSLRSGLTVALKARGRAFGTITWVNGEEGRRFGPEDVEFGEDLARRAAIAIDNAQLHSELRQIADRLQEAVLPPKLPVLDGWQLAASYATAGRVDVGGDFYDVIPLHDGRLAFAIGDVMGRGVEAAAAMAQVRAALRAFIAVDPEPRKVLTRLDLLYERFPSEQLVTLLYAVADPAADELAVCSAGHLPPALIDGHRSAEYVDVAGTILGVDRAERKVATIPFAPGQTLLLFTDGLVERRDEDLETGKKRLLDACAQLRPGMVGADLDRLTELMRDPTRDDDVAVLAVTRSLA